MATRDLRIARDGGDSATVSLRAAPQLGAPPLLAKLIGLAAALSWLARPLHNLVS